MASDQVLRLKCICSLAAILVSTATTCIQTSSFLASMTACGLSSPLLLLSSSKKSKNDFFLNVKDYVFILLKLSNSFPLHPSCCVGSLEFKR